MRWMCNYPSNLNVSAIDFERSGDGGTVSTSTRSSPRVGPWDTAQSRKPIEAVGGHGYSRKRSRVVCEEECKSLADDIILSRLSSLLRAGGGATATEATCEASAFALIPGETSVILPASTSTSSASDATPLNESASTASLLRSVGVEEIESLDPSNGGAGAGQCQFACLALALSKSLGVGTKLRDGHRPDLELRELALHVVQNNARLYRDFLTVARGRTRAQHLEGGSAVDLNAYLRRMSDPSCDGDAVTLQALCDALKITVRVVKSVDACEYDEESQRKRIQAAATNYDANTSTTATVDDASVTSGVASVSADSSNTDTEDMPVSSSASSFETTCSNIFWPSNPYASTSIASGLTFDASNQDYSDYNRNQRLLCVSQEIRPRPLDFVDSRIRDIQDKLFGRLIWLSHIGGEAHYRFLRPTEVHVNGIGETDTPNDSLHCLCGAVNEQEASITSLSRLRRMALLRRSCLKDGYAHRALPSEMSNKSKFNVLKKKWASDIQMSPRCGLCFDHLFQTRSSVNVKTITIASPSCCHHEFCRECLASWASNASHTCPTCRSNFSSLVSSASGKSLDTCTMLKSRQSTVSVPSEVPVRPLRTRPRRHTRASSELIDDNIIVSSDDESPIGVGLLTPTLKPPPALPEEYESDIQDDASPLRLARKALLDVSQDHIPVTFLRKYQRSRDETSVLELLHRLTAVATESALPDLLDTGILSAIRLTLTPSYTATSYISTSIGSSSSSNGLSECFVPTPSVFEACVLLLDYISDRCWCEKKWLSLTILESSLGLPKLLLWYITCSTLPPDFFDAIGGVLRTLQRWSSQFELSTIAALQYESTCNTTVASGPKLPQKGDKRKSLPASPGPKSKKSKTSSLGRPNQKKNDQQCDTITIKRASGKRKIKPVLLSNISREQWGLVRY